MNASRRDILLGLAVFAGVLALVFGIFRIAQNERSFELDRWEVRLHADAEQRVAKVNAWLGESVGEMRAVATNPTAQIYLSEIAAANFDATKVPEGAAQNAFLASYVASLGMRGPFASPSGGLAVLDAHFHVVATTLADAPDGATIARLIADRGRGQDTPKVLQTGGKARIGFLVAIRPLQLSATAAPIGYVVAQRDLNGQFWSSDNAAPAAEHRRESLVAVQDNTASPISASIAPGDNRSVGEGEAALAPMHLVSAKDFGGRDALHFAQKVSDAPWFVVESVSAKSAMAGVDERIRNLVLMLLLILIIIIVAVLGLWRHTVGAREVEARDASLKMYRGLVDLLLEAVDQREPGAAAHSRRVAQLSRRTALIMGAKPADADVAEMAGALLNVGKLFVPADLLARAGALDDAERAAFDESHARWLDLTSRLPMDPPLEPVLRDALALTHGKAVDGAAIPRDSYIIAAANKAVALMSPRAYRPARDEAETLEILRTESPKFPASVVDALSAALAKTA